MGLMSEFKAFALRGNVVDMAVGIIIGGAFGAIVGSLVSDILMPVVGYLTGGVNFKDMSIVLGEGEKAPKIGYGALFDAIVKFVIVAFALFMVIKAMNSAKKKEEAKPAAPAAPPAQEVLLAEIRDLLKKQKG
ncbi:MAG: large-conductance mechanosensitive channel protein MscL [Planctomycetes bacterium]|nr:large-conductance mechanosensitive channel protein MscL [Planctomycetota bacterium]